MRRGHAGHRRRFGALHAGDEAGGPRGGRDSAPLPAHLVLRRGGPADGRGRAHGHDQDDRGPQGFVGVSVYV
jgi:hypothetical protein